MPRPKKTPQEIAEMRKRILNAAMALLEDEGIAGLSIRKIGRRLGVSHMVLYTYFENRNAVVEALKAQWLERLETKRAQALRQPQTGDALVAFQGNETRDQPGRDTDGVAQRGQRRGEVLAVTAAGVEQELDDRIHRAASRPGELDVTQVGRVAEVATAHVSQQRTRGLGIPLKACLRVVRRLGVEARRAEHSPRKLRDPWVHLAELVEDPFSARLLW